MLQGAVIKQLLARAGEVTGRFKGQFQLSRINLVRAALPRELEAARENLAARLPIIIERNTRQLGKVPATGYVPPAVVVSGGQHRAELLKQGAIHAWAWVEAGALPTTKQDTISASELISALHDLLKPRNPLAEAGRPWIADVYPLENNFIMCNRAGQQFRQRFSVNGQKNIALDGGPSLVQVSTVNASLRDMGLVEQLANGSHCGAAAVQKYVAATRTGAYKPLAPDFAPVKLSGLGKIVAGLAAAGIQPVDYVRWFESCGCGCGKPSVTEGGDEIVANENEDDTTGRIIKEIDTDKKMKAKGIGPKPSSLTAGGPGSGRKSSGGFAGKLQKTIGKFNEKAARDKAAIGKTPMVSPETHIRSLNDGPQYKPRAPKQPAEKKLFDKFDRGISGCQSLTPTLSAGGPGSGRHSDGNGPRKQDLPYSQWYKKAGKKSNDAWAKTGLTKGTGASAHATAWKAHTRAATAFSKIGSTKDAVIHNNQAQKHYEAFKKLGGE